MAAGQLTTGRSPKAMKTMKWYFSWTDDVNTREIHVADVVT